jgi:hypothetical protein
LSAVTLFQGGSKFVFGRDLAEQVVDELLKALVSRFKR